MFTLKQANYLGANIVVCAVVYALLTTTQNGNRNVNKWSGGHQEPTTPFPLCVRARNLFRGDEMLCLPSFDLRERRFSL